MPERVLEYYSLSKTYYVLPGTQSRAYIWGSSVPGKHRKIDFKIFSRIFFTPINKMGLLRVLGYFRKIDDFWWVNFRDLYLGAGDEFRWVSAPLRTSTERNLNDKDKFEMLKIAANTFFRHIFIRLSNGNGIFKRTYIFQCSMGCTYFDEIDDFWWVNFTQLELRTEIG